MTRTYLALGDSMSIDDYTGVEGGGAVAQLFKRLGLGWSLVDKTLDGCVMPLVPTDLQGDLVTLTIGGNDLLGNLERYLMTGDEAELDPSQLGEFATEHQRLLEQLRAKNPGAVIVVGNIYKPDISVPAFVDDRLAWVNATIAANIARIDGRLADLHAALLGKHHTHLTQRIEPNLEGARVICEAFGEALTDDDKRSLGLS